MRRRDDTEFTEFAVAPAPRMRRTAYLLCGDWQRTEDATQDALVKVYRRWSHLHRDGRLEAYAHRAVDDRAVVVQALSTLPAGQRSCIVLRYYVDLSVEQTAEALGTSASSVRSQTSRGLVQLRHLLALPERSSA